MVLDALSPQRRRLVFGVGGLVLLLIVTIALVGVVRMSITSVHPVPQNDPGPVLLVPGYGGNVQSLQPLAAALRSAGRTVAIVEPVGDGTGDLRIQAEHLREVAERVRRFDEHFHAAAGRVELLACGLRDRPQAIEPVVLRDDLQEPERRH